MMPEWPVIVEVPVARACPHPVGIVAVEVVVEVSPAVVAVEVVVVVVAAVVEAAAGAAVEVVGAAEGE
jgi:hypothetical protein